MPILLIIDKILGPMKKFYIRNQKSDVFGIISFLLVIVIFISFFVKAIMDIKKYNIQYYYKGEVISKVQKITREDTLYWIELKQYNKDHNEWIFIKLKVDKFKFNKIKLGRRLNPNIINEKIN